MEEQKQCTAKDCDWIGKIGEEEVNCPECSTYFSLEPVEVKQKKTPKEKLAKIKKKNQVKAEPSIKDVKADYYLVPTGDNGWVHSCVDRDIAVEYEEDIDDLVEQESFITGIEVEQGYLLLIRSKKSNKGKVQEQRWADALERINTDDRMKGKLIAVPNYAGEDATNKMLADVDFVLCSNVLPTEVVFKAAEEDEEESDADEEEETTNCSGCVKEYDGSKLNKKKTGWAMLRYTEKTETWDRCKANDKNGYLYCEECRPDLAPPPEEVEETIHKIEKNVEQNTLNIHNMMKVVTELKKNPPTTTSNTTSGSSVTTTTPQKQKSKPKYVGLMNKLRDTLWEIMVQATNVQDYRTTRWCSNYLAEIEGFSTE